MPGISSNTKSQKVILSGYETGYDSRMTLTFRLFAGSQKINMGANFVGSTNSELPKIVVIVVLSTLYFTYFCADCKFYTVYRSTTESPSDPQELGITVK